MRTSLPGRPATLALAVLLVIMPCLAIATLANPILQEGLLDPYFYTALIHDPLQVLRRYGSTYYANRVAFTVPARGAILLLGDRWGHFLIETGYLLAATLSGFALGRRYFSTAVGIAAAAWVAFNPWLIRSLTWDYVEGAAVCAMLVAFCCFALNGKRPLLLHAFGGLAFSLAFNTDQFVGAMAVAFAPAWLILNLPRGVAHCLRCAVIALAAFVLGYAGLILVEYLQLPALGFGRELVTFGEAANLLQGGGAVWYHPVSAYLAPGNIYILMPAFLSAGLVTLLVAEQAARRRVDRFTIAATVSLVLTGVAYLLFHYALRTALLTEFMYDAYAFPAGLLAIIGLIGRCTGTLSTRAGAMVCAAAPFCFALLWIDYEAWQGLLPMLTARAFAIFACVFVALMAANWVPILRAVGALLGACMAIVIFYFGATHYYTALHDPSLRAPERDLYTGAVFLQNVVAQTLPVSAGPVGFWYGNRPEDAMFDSVQSTFLWSYSRVVSGPLPDKPGAHLTVGLRRQLADYSHIVILSHADESADDALQALGADGAVARVHARFTFPSPWFSFIVTIVDYVPPPGPVGALVGEIPLGNLAAENQASITAADGSIELRTAPQRWAYSAFVLLPRDLPQGKLVLRVHLRVLRGQVGVLATAKLSAQPMVESSAGPTATPRDVDLAIPDSTGVGSLIIRNRAPFGPSFVQVSGIEVFRASP
jgi:hypothetical protein